MVYAQEVSSMASEGLDFRNGTAITQRIKGTDYVGVTGSLRIATNGQRERDFVMKNFDMDPGQFKVPVSFQTTDNSMKETIYFKSLAVTGLYWSTRSLNYWNYYAIMTRQFYKS